MQNPVTFIKTHRTERYLLIAFCALVIFPLVMHEILGKNGYLDRRRQRTQLQALTADLEKLKQENTQLNQKIKALLSDPDTIEKLARERLNLGRPGDVVVTLPPTDPPAAAASR